MLLLAVLFVLFIIALAFFLNSLLDGREVRRLGREEKDRDAPL